MLKVQDLQQFVQSILRPLEAAEVSAKIVTRSARLATCLDPFRDAELAAFADFLQKADTAVKTGQWPAPMAKAGRGGAAKEPKAPKLTVEEAAQRVMEIYERAAADPGLDFAEVDRVVLTLEPMTVPDLKKLAGQVDVSPPSKAKKPDILKAIGDSIKKRKEDRRRPSSGTPGHAMAAAGDER